jgi:2-succinyl-6-hydroxy-2,4-cyclohexadiene-1-carboxylate synthase
MNPEILAHERFGVGQPSLTFVHGFTQTRESWRPIASRFASTNHVTLIDLPGHGRSQVAARDLMDAGRLLVDISLHDVVIGYSMGARVALHGALRRNNAIRGLVLIGVHPGIVSDEERDDRRRSDEELAAHIERVGTAAFIDEWLSQPMFEAIRHLDHDDRLGNSAHGLAESLRRLGTGTQEVLDARMAEITCPVLLLAGQRDTKFVQLAKRMEKRLTNARLETIAGAGHACHLEQPDATVEVLRAWLDSVGK